MIEYMEIRSEFTDDVYKLYEENQWNAYLDDKEKIARALDHSLCMIGAFENEQLVGFVRCVGDGEYIVYIQDLIVKPSHFGRGIGRELMNRISEKYPVVRQFVLITDATDEAANNFYRSIGLVNEFKGFPVTHYFRKS